MFAIHLLLPALLALPNLQQPGGTLNVPSTQYPTIQSAINAAVSGNTVLVAPATYVENLDFMGKAITVKSIGSASVTTINGSQGGSVVTFSTNEPPSAVLEGFTITGGSGTFVSLSSGTGYVGGGIFCRNASPTIRDNIVAGNALSGPYMNGGGGIMCLDGGTPLIVSNIIELNTVTGNATGGGGIACWSGGSPTIRDNDIRSNTVTATGLAGAGGILCQLPGTRPTITHNRIYRNSAPHGGGMQCSGNSQPTIANNEIFENTGTIAAGGIQFFVANIPVVITNNTFWGNNTPGNGGAVFCNTTSRATIRDSILWNNSAGTGNEIYVTNTASLTVSHCDVQGGQAAAFVTPTATLNWGAGMIDQNPQFTAPATGNFALSGTSPCVDSGDPASDPCLKTDIAGNPRLLDGLLNGTMRIDMGAHEFGNVHLAITGPTTVGSTLAFNTSGTPGLLVFIAIAGAPGQLCIRPFGPLFFNPASVWVTDSFGTIPNTVSIVVPTLLTPVDLWIQEVAIGPSAGNTSNVVKLTIQ